MMTYTAVLAAALAGAGAQEVAYVGGGRLSMVTGPTFDGASWSGGAGAVHSVPASLAQADVRYFDVDPAAGAELELRPETGAAPARAASELAGGPRACGMGWARSRNGDHEEFAGLVPAKTAAWGWTNPITAGTTVEADVIIGNEPAQQTRFHIEVEHEGSEIYVKLTPVAGWELRAAAIYVGREKLPRGANGAFTASPGQFPIQVNVRDEARVRVSEAIPTLDIDATGVFYFAVHVNVCPGATPEPMGVQPNGVETPECETTFFVSVFTCLDSACVQRSTGDIHADLVAAGWVAYTDAPRFTLSEPVSSFVYNTRVYAKTVRESEGPLTIPSSPFIGVFAAGCGVTARPQNAPALAFNIGPVRDLCTQYCPAGAA